MVDRAGAQADMRQGREVNMFGERPEGIRGNNERRVGHWGDKRSDLWVDAAASRHGLRDREFASTAGKGSAKWGKAKQATPSI